jgi:hypothetical protein
MLMSVRPAQRGGQPAASLPFHLGHNGRPMQADQHLQYATVEQRAQKLIDNIQFVTPPPAIQPISAYLFDHKHKVSLCDVSLKLSESSYWT